VTETATLFEPVYSWPKDAKVDFDAIGAKILNGGGPRCVKVTIKPRHEHEPDHIYCLARHTDCAAILMDEDRFDLSQYDASFNAMGDNLYALLGAKTEARERRTEMLRQATSHMAAQKTDASPPPLAQPQSGAALLNWIEEISLQNAHEILSILHKIAEKSDKPAKTFNAVREYIWPLTYLSVRQIVGISLPEKMPIFVRLYIAASNLMKMLRGKKRFKPIGLLAASSNMHFWMLTIGGEIVKYGTGKNSAVSYLAKNSMQHFLRSLEESLDSPEYLASGSIAHSLMNEEVRRNFPELSDDEYQIQVRNIVMELAIAMGGLMPMAMCNIMQFVFGKSGKNTGLNIDKFFDDMDSNERAISAIREAIRLNPAAIRVYRRVTTPTNLDGLDFEEGDWIALLLSSAAKDPKSVEMPNKYQPGLERESLEFGIDSSAHSCFGQYAARTISRAMFKEIWKVARPVDTGVNDPYQKFAGLIPDDMQWQFGIPKKQPEKKRELTREEKQVSAAGRRE